MSSPTVDLRNTFLAGIYLVFGAIASVILLFVILIHLRYPKFRQNMYSIIFSCLLSEIIIPIHYFYTGIRRIIFGELEKVDTLCIINATLVDLAVVTLIFYNILTTMLLMFDKLPSSFEEIKKTKQRRINTYNTYIWNKYAYTIVHTVAITLGLVHAYLFYFLDFYGITTFGDCFIKLEHSPYLFLLGLPVFIYALTSFVYILLNLKKKYYIKFPILKHYSIYLFITALSWCWSLMRNFIKEEHINGYNSIVLTSQLVCCIVIIYIRINNGYIQTILNQGDSNSKFLQALLIFCCMDDNNVDIELYERRATIKLNALSGEFNIKD